jgi:hypothetical protein
MNGIGRTNWSYLPTTTRRLAVNPPAVEGYISDLVTSPHYANIGSITVCMISLALSKPSYSAAAGYFTSTVTISYG